LAAAACTFYFDLASPLAYLASEQVLQLARAPMRWEPVLARELPGGGGGVLAPHQREEIARRARAQGLQPLRWPERFPFDSALAMRVATYAQSIGRVVPFAQAAFRQAFAGGHDLERLDFVLIAAAACEMHPNAVRRGAQRRAVGEALARATLEAARAGVSDVPALRMAPL
jgi:2-hydroxychromene-2-carboxylate isomerase